MAFAYILPETGHAILVTLTSDLLTVKVLGMWYFVAATSLPSLKTVQPSVHKLLRILLIDF